MVDKIQKPKDLSTKIWKLFRQENNLNLQRDPATKKTVCILPSGSTLTLEQLKGSYAYTGFSDGIQGISPKIGKDAVSRVVISSPTALQAQAERVKETCDMRSRQELETRPLHLTSTIVGYCLQYGRGYGLREDFLYESSR